MEDDLEEIRYVISAKNHMIRRSIHLISGLVVVYYLFPPTFLHIPMKLWLILLLGVVPLVVEMVRIRKGKVLFGQREHEKQNVASYAWALWTSMALMLVLPQQIAFPVIIIYTVADPVISEIRLWRKWLVMPLGMLFTWIMFMCFGYHPILAVFAASSMVLGEALEIIGMTRMRPELFRIYRNANFTENIILSFKTDDNATTQIVPGLALGLVYIFYPGWFPGPWLYPLFG